MVSLSCFLAGKKSITSSRTDHVYNKIVFQLWGLQAHAAFNFWKH